MKDSGRTLSFSMDVKLGRPIVFVKNMANGDVVRQIPSEVVVRVAHGIEDFKGLLHNEAAWSFEETLIDATKCMF